jgi:hypothetical protein
MQSPTVFPGEMTTVEVEASVRSVVAPPINYARATLAVLDNIERTLAAMPIR